MAPWYLLLGFVLAVVVLVGFVVWARLMQRRVGRPSDDPSDPIKRYSFFFHQGGSPPNA